MKSLRVLIIRLGAFGDILHTLPVAHTLRMHYPQAHITWAVEAPLTAVLEDNPDIDRLLVINTKRWRRSWTWETVTELRAVTQQLREAHFDVVLDVQGLLKSGILGYLTQAPVRIGFHTQDCREAVNTLFTSHQIAPVVRGQHVIYRNLALLQALEITKPAIAFPFYIPTAAEEKVEAMLQYQGIHDPFVVLNPGGGWRTKLWGSANYAFLSDAIRNRFGLRTVLTWGPGEEELAQEIAMRSRFAPPFIPPYTTIKELAAILQRALLVVGGDTGPLHLAAALQKPVVGIYGPSDPVRNGPFGTEHVIIRRLLPCSNCFRRTCPTIQCLHEVSVEEVIQGMEVLLRRIQRPTVKRFPVFS
jgi:lipopolysaccharide heptosyltransferase I